MAPLACGLAFLFVQCAPAARSNSPPNPTPPVDQAPSYAWRLPPGFPIPRVPADNPMTPEKVELGRRLFYDKALSGNGTYACASCHSPEIAFTDGHARAVGSTGELHPRSAMSLANVAYSATLTWADPDLTRLEEQMLTPMFNQHPVELGLAGQEEALTRRLEANPGYASGFAAAFPGDSRPVNLLNLRRAIASFERTLVSGDAPYDRLVYRGEPALSEPALRGMRLFFSDRLKCSRCHGGFTFSGPVAFVGLEPVAPTFHNTGLYNLGGAGGYPEDNPGVFEHTRKDEDMGRFRAPTLRNVEVTAPYMHDGSIATLEEVLAHYAAGGRTIPDGPLAGIGRDNPHKSDLIQGFELDADQRTDLIEFLKSLTDRSFLTDPRFADPGRNPLPQDSLLPP
jgi:cytochrome c peroxidase